MATKVKPLAVESSTVKAVGYDKEKKKLHVWFHSKEAHYVYHPIEENTYLEMVAADSVGKYLNENIKKNDAIEYQKIS